MISWDGRSRTIVVDGHPERAASVQVRHDGWRAVLPIGRQVELTLTAGQPQVESVWAKLWARPLSRGVGVAVVQLHGEPAGLARIPVCECGEQGCANAGNQLSAQIDSTGASALLDLLDRLPMVGAFDGQASTWQPDPPTIAPTPGSGGGWYNYAPNSGATFRPGPDGSQPRRT